MTRPATVTQQVIIIATKNKETVNVNSLHLPLLSDSDQLEAQLSLFGDVLGYSNSEQDRAAQMSKLHPQMKALFIETERLIKLSRLPISAASTERTLSTLCCLKSWLRTTMTQKRLADLALKHVHGDVWDSLGIGSLMEELHQHHPPREKVCTCLQGEQNHGRFYGHVC